MATEIQHRTFLSYSRANKDFAVRLAKELKSEGFDIWLDMLDIPLGARWDVEVEKALEECEIFMIIMTPASIASENVRDEIGYAIDNGKRFLPVLLENCNVPLRLRRFQYVDFTTKSFDDGVESAKDLLRNLIAQITIPRKEVSEEIQARLAQAEADRVAQEKAEAERKAKEEADRLAAQKAEDERLAKVKAETEQKAKEEADRLAAKKVEDERQAKVKAEADQKAKEEADRLAAKKAEDERLAKVKAEADRKAKEEADRLAAQKAEVDQSAKEKVEEKAVPVTAATLAEKPRKSRKFTYIGIGIFLCVALVFGGFVILPSLFGGYEAPVSEPTAIIVETRITATPKNNNAVALEATNTPAKPTQKPSVNTSATQNAQATAEAQEKMNYLNDLMEVAKLTFGPENGAVFHDPSNTFIETYELGGYFMKNFVVETLVYNPYAASENPWDFGFIFRNTGSNYQYRIVIHSDGWWQLSNNTGSGDGQVLESGDISGLNTSEGGSNLFLLSVDNEVGMLFLNGNFVSYLDLSERQDIGDLKFGVGFFSSDEIGGASTRFENMSLWKLP